jgi:hypothetical protein
MYNIVQEKMNLIETPTPTLTPKQKKQIANKKYYHKRYATDPEFRQKELDRNSTRVLHKYANDPEYKERVKKQALDRYYRLKAEKEKKEIEERMLQLKALKI